jgi:hypothetical protein
MSFNLSTRINNLYVLLQQIIAGTVSNPMVANLNMNNFSITNANTITASVGINTPLINGQSLPVSSRASSSAIIGIGTGYTTVLSTTITNTTPKDIDIWANINFQYNGIPNGVFVRVVFDGTPIGDVQIITLENMNAVQAENRQATIIVSQLNATAGLHTINLDMLKTINSGTLLHNNSTCVLIGL